jgi:hypothetical protein
MSRLLLLACLLFSGPALATPVQTPLERVGGLGINLDEFRYWIPCWAFTDAMVLASEWYSQTPSAPEPFGNGQPLAKDPNGWPLVVSGQAAGAYIWKDQNGRYPGGLYGVTWEGSGAINPDGDASLSQQLTPNHALWQVTPGNFGIIVRVMSSDPLNPVRNIRLALPGFANGFQPGQFHPLFLERLAPFGVLRSMQWQNINFNPLVHWADRSTPSTYSQGTERGVCHEYLVALANKTKKAVWYCIPHLANDDYVRQAARFVAENQHPDVPAFIEYSNEVWNADFPAFHHAKAQGLAAGLASLEFDAAMRWYSQRSVQVLDIWQQEFQAVSGAHWSKRLVRVLAAQYANPYVGEVVADWQNAYQHADAIAIAPYFGVEYGLSQNLGTTLSKSNAQILAECATEIQTTLKSRVEAYQQLASARGLALIGYEGGQHLVPVGISQTSIVVVNKLIAINRDPGMYALFQQLMNVWKNAGGKVLLPYSFLSLYTKYGSWGLMEYLDQPLSQAHKYRALEDWGAQQPATPQAYSFGQACGSLALGYAGTPKVGSADFAVGLTGTQPNAPVQLGISIQTQTYLGLPLPLDLTGYAGLGCTLFIGDGTLFAGQANAAGSASQALPIPPNPALAGARVYLQWLAIEPGFGFFSMALSEALDVQIGA